MIIKLGQGILSTWKAKGNEWISMKSPMMLIYASELLRENESNFFYDSHLQQTVRESMDPTMWWKTAVKTDLTQDIKTVVDRIFLLPASTSGIERSFSTLSQIMTKQRNRLSVEKAEKLCVISNYYKIVNSESRISSGLALRKKQQRKFPETDSNFSA